MLSIIKEKSLKMDQFGIEFKRKSVKGGIESPLQTPSTMMKTKTMRKETMSFKVSFVNDHEQL